LALRLYSHRSRRQSCRNWNVVRHHKIVWLFSSRLALANYPCPPGGPGSPNSTLILGTWVRKDRDPTPPAPAPTSQNGSQPPPSPKGILPLVSQVTCLSFSFFTLYPPSHFVPLTASQTLLRCITLVEVFITSQIFPRLLICTVLSPSTTRRHYIIALSKPTPSFYLSLPFPALPYFEHTKPNTIMRSSRSSSNASDTFLSEPQETLNIFVKLLTGESTYLLKHHPYQRQVS
jgi:hypothetical protein